MYAKGEIYYCKDFPQSNKKHKSRPVLIINPYEGSNSVLACKITSTIPHKHYPTDFLITLKGQVSCVCVGENHSVLKTMLEKKWGELNVEQMKKFDECWLKVGQIKQEIIEKGNVMNELKIFENPEFGKIRTTIVDGEPLIVAADICTALGISNSRDAVSRLDYDEKDVVSTDTLGGKQNMTAVNEYGLYSLVLGSRKQTDFTRRFKRWVTHDILPSIRKNGGYISGQENMTNEEFLAKAVIFAKSVIEDKDKQIQIMTPKAEYYDKLVDRNNLTNFRDTAKMLGTTQNKFIAFLLTNDFIYYGSHNKILPTKKSADGGLMEIKETINQKTDWQGLQTMVTIKGREEFMQLLDKAGYERIKTA